MASAAAHNAPAGNGVDGLPARGQRTEAIARLEHKIAEIASLRSRMQHQLENEVVNAHPAVRPCSRRGRSKPRGLLTGWCAVWPGAGSERNSITPPLRPGWTRWPSKSRRCATS